MATEKRPIGRFCGARTRFGQACRKWAITGRARCRLHGGVSTGPKTAEGISRIQSARTVHGRYSKAFIAERQKSRMLIKEARCLPRSLEREDPSVPVDDLYR
ncbi:MAG: HGGxSTG domain-containing protein [Bryobacteraceae bacterium]